MSTSENDMQQQLRQTIQQLMTQYGSLNQKNSQLQSIDWSKMSADDLRTVLNASIDQEKQNQNNKKLLRVNQLQDANARSPDQGQSVPQGSVYIPPNAFSRGIGIANQLQAMRTQSNVQDDQAGIDARDSSLPELFRRLLQGKSPASSTLGNPPYPTDEDEEEDPQQ